LHRLTKSTCNEPASPIDHSPLLAEERPTQESVSFPPQNFVCAVEPIILESACCQLWRGARIVVVGEYEKMQQTFRLQALEMAGAVLLIYFLMGALFRSYVTPLVVLSALPVGLVDLPPLTESGC
jgi:hypothetical protein